MGDKRSPLPPNYIPFKWKIILGAMSGCASTTILQPADLVKTRMQLLKGCKISFITKTRHIVVTEGFQGLYRGFSAALLRQVIYSGTRLGGFNEAVDQYQMSHNSRMPRLGKKMLIGLLAGTAGAVLSMPPEVVLIRMSADGRLPPEQRRNYKHVFDAMSRMTREEGVSSLLKGFWPTLVRSMILNASQLATYSEARERLTGRLGEGVTNHFTSSLVAGFLTTVASQPVDTIKTQIQFSKEKTTQFQVIKSIVARSGILGLWAGFIPNYLKIGPHTVLTFMFLEQLKHIYLTRGKEPVFKK